MNFKNSSRGMNASWHGCSVSTVMSYGIPVRIGFRPITSPALAIFRMKVLPSLFVVSSFARPWHSRWMPRAPSPSITINAPSGYVLTCMIGRKAAREGSENPQKNCVLRTLQLLQSSSIGRPYGVRVLLRSSVLCRRLETSGLSASIEFDMSPFPLLRFLSCFASAEGQLEGLTGAIRSFWSNLCNANKILCLCRMTRLGKATETFGMKPELGHFPQNCVILITVLCDI